MNNKNIPPFDYLTGSEFTKRLKNLTNCDDFQELSSLLNVPKTTFSTWNTHDRTSHELIVRLHLALGIPVEELALKPEDRKKLKSTVSEMRERYDVLPITKQESPQHATTILKSFCLANGQLIETGEIPYPVRRMNSFNLDAEKVIEVETNEAIYLLDKSTTDAVAGNYLIDVDGRLSINQIQRLPGRKLAIAFGDSTIEASENDIKVLGRVAVTMKKD
ncbi:phage repressor protein CI [Vibrio sp. V08_P9A1T1]|uniref:phage repressor protein CI n=1 Tax=Vibrio sp. V08_P9A1T1 TaxID=1938663 RepID=UPI000B8E6682|nr:phage repressor protein CI [Vibrio sp. V08_P9A1T1]OXX29096.1 chromosome partitioning protein ParA [Vibrio sp. V08_P9A1T1]